MVVRVREEVLYDNFLKAKCHLYLLLKTLGNTVNFEPQFLRANEVATLICSAISAQENFNDLPENWILFSSTCSFLGGKRQNAAKKITLLAEA